MALPIMGLSWLAVETTSSFLLFATSQAQPEPKRLAPRVVHRLLEFSRRSPKEDLRRVGELGRRFLLLRPL